MTRSEPMFPMTCINRAYPGPVIFGPGQSHQNRRHGIALVCAVDLPRSGASYQPVILSAVPCGRRREGTESKNLSHPAGGGGAELRARSCSAPPPPEEKVRGSSTALRPLARLRFARMTGFFDAPLRAKPFTRTSNSMRCYCGFRPARTARRFVGNIPTLDGEITPSNTAIPAICAG